MNAEIPDGDLVRLARDDDPVAFRLLVERHQPTVRARARSLCVNLSDVDDVVQESFLRAFIGLDRLRDPDRFAGWLGGITANVCRGLGRRAPVTLLPDWPEPLHPTAADGLPSADDLDRADALRAAVAGLPADSGAPSPCTTTPTCPPPRSPSRPARPGPACTRPGSSHAPISSSTAPTLFPPPHGGH